MFSLSQGIASEKTLIPTNKKPMCCAWFCLVQSHSSSAVWAVQGGYGFDRESIYQYHCTLIYDGGALLQIASETFDGFYEAVVISTPPPPMITITLLLRLQVKELARKGHKMTFFLRLQVKELARKGHEMTFFPTGGSAVQAILGILLYISIFCKRKRLIYLFLISSSIL